MNGSSFITYNTLIVLLGTSLLGGTAGLVGTFAVLRRRSLTGDALAHASLPGLCLAFLVWGERNLLALLIGAFCSGLLGVAVISGLRRFTRIKEDAAIGIVLSVFFGAGISLSRIIQNQVTSGSKAGLDSYILGKTAGMLAQDVYLLAGLSLACFLIIVFLFKEFSLVVFDPAFARVQGWPAFLLDLGMMALIAVVVVVGLPTVGVVLMASLLILPGVAARFWTDRLQSMVWLSLIFGACIGWVGTLISANYSLFPAGPIIVLTGTVLFLVSMFFAPRRGVIARRFADYHFHRKLRLDAFLRRIYRAKLRPEQLASAKLTLSPLRMAVKPEPRIVQLAIEQGLIVPARENTVEFTRDGEQFARQLVRDEILRQQIILRYPQLSAELYEEDDLRDWQQRFPDEYQVLVADLPPLPLPSEWRAS
ncbi:MAG: iron chelate uptake ABC transporter family permease subunit [Planctomycetales bacterium]